jgi:glyoxylase-like metal-dependent hydrolase (beta-lactamase superfamily II)
MKQTEQASATRGRRTLVWLAAVACLGLVWASAPVLTQGRAGGGGRQGGAAAAAPKAEWPPKLVGPAPGELQVLPVAGNVHVIIGAGANITVQAGPQGVLVVDTGTAAMSAKVIAAIKSISTKPLRYIVNTTHTLEHTGGNLAIAKTGEIIPFREPDYAAGPQGALDTHKASVIAYLTVFHRMAAATGAQATPEEGWPDNTYSIAQKRLYFNDEPVVITHFVGNDDGNSVVLFRKSDVVAVGDLLDLTMYPRIDVENGGGLQQMVDSMNKLIDIVVPEANAAGGTLVIPAHGRIADHAEVVYYRDMLAIIRDRMQDALKRKLTVAQVKAERPTRDYDARYGKTTGPWTTDMFVEAAYKSLMK